MRVLIVLPWDDLNAIGGVNIVVRQLTSYLKSQGDDVLLMTPKWSGSVNEEEFQTTRVFRFPMRSPVAVRRTLRSRVGFLLLLPITLWRLSRLLRKEQIDAVNFQYFSDEVFYFVVLKRWMRFRLIVSMHGSDLLADNSQYYLSVLNRWIPRIDELVACSAALKSAALPEGSPAAERSRVVRNSVDVSGITTPIVRSNAVISVANLIPRKGLDILIEAFALLAPRHPDWELWVIGSGELLESLRAQSRRTKCEAAIHFFGKMERSEALTRLAQAKVFCLSSHREGLSLAVLEAMALKTAVIATRVEGTPEAIENGVHGLVVQPGSVSELSSALEELISDERKRAQLAENAYIRIQREFTYENWGRRYRELLSG